MRKEKDKTKVRKFINFDGNLQNRTGVAVSQTFIEQKYLFIFVFVK
jgi:hypothetical protein